MLITIDNTYFLVSLPALTDFAPGDVLLYPLADEVKPRAIFGDLNESRATTNDLEPHANTFDVIKKMEWPHLLQRLPGTILSSLGLKT